MSEIVEYLITNAAEIIGDIFIALCLIFGKKKTAEEIQQKQEKERAKKAKRAEKLLNKAGKLTEELKEEKKE